MQGPALVVIVIVVAVAHATDLPAASVAIEVQEGNEISQGLIVLSFISDHFLENRDAWFIAERLAQGEVHSAYPCRQGFGLSRFTPRLLGHLSTEFQNAFSPKAGMMLFCSGQTRKAFRRCGFSLSFGQRRVGVMAFHLRLPVGLQRCE